MPGHATQQGFARRVIDVSLLLTAGVDGAKVRAARPNNTTAYAANGVWGDAADARYAFVIPPLPRNSRLPFFTGLSILFVQGTTWTQGTTPLNLIPFLQKPATALGDQAQFSLSDADIALIPSGVLTANTPNPTVTINTSNTNALNVTAGAAAGRRAQFAASVLSSLQVAAFRPGDSMWFYLYAQAAYTPVASETIDLYPFWTYTMAGAL